MAASFNGHSFRFRGNGGTRFPVWDKGTILTLKDLPTGAQTIVDIGADVQRVTIVARCTKTQLTALYGDLLTTASLVLPWETHNALLESIDNAFLVVTGQDVYEAALHFIRS